MALPATWSIAATPTHGGNGKWFVRERRGKRAREAETADVLGMEDSEEKIAKFHRQEDAILYASCFDANAGIFEAMLTQQDVLFSDQLNHASIIDGVRLAKTNKCRYTHRSK